MKFEILNYQKAKEEVITLIKESHDWEDNEGFIADGIICPTIYENEKIKVLVILAESYGYSDHSIVDIEKQLEDDILGLSNYKVQTPKKIGALLWLFFESLKMGRELTWEEFPDLLQMTEDNYNKLQFALSKIAWINVKKGSKYVDDEDNVSTKLDYTEIYNSGLRNRDILKMQIKSISPDIIIACSDPVIQTLYDHEILDQDVDKNLRFRIQINSKGHRFYFISHPAYLTDWGYRGIFETYQILYRSFT